MIFVSFGTFAVLGGRVDSQQVGSRGGGGMGGMLRS
jgi:hypothetical protein